MATSDNLENLADALWFETQDALRYFADEAEFYAKNNKKWDKDSGSAEASITGFLADDFEGHKKNYDDPEWLTAQTPGYVSPHWQNEYDNFIPYEGDDRDIQADIAVVLAMFVRYGADIKDGAGQAVFTETLSATADGFYRAALKGLGAALTKPFQP